MSKLRAYRSKRRFTRTPEPYGEERASDPDALAFVLQHHAARRPHFDLRLELGGVLKSWAVPEGPSADPSVRRLAVATEDHPLAYAAFEGEIPAGQYGAGVIRLWDQGHWVPLGDPAAALEAGELKFRLAGARLGGGWMLKKLPEEGDAWLLIKERDQAAGVALDLGAFEPGPPAKAGPAALEAAADPALEGIGVAAPAPKRLRPQLPSSAPVPPAGEGWIHEIKYDGYRTLVFIEDGAVRLITRQGLDWTERYGALAAAFDALDCRDAVLDGEVVAQDGRGATTLDLLQETLSAGRDHELVYYAFDLVHFEGRDLRGAPLLQRKALLRRLLPDEMTARIQYSDHVDGEGRALFAEICRLGLEGIVSKAKGARYQEGRATSWLKVKRFDVGRFTVIGFTTKASDRHAASVILAEEDAEAEAGLRYVGRAGSGLTNEQARGLYETLAPLALAKPPIAVPKIDNPHWIAPSGLTAEISYRGRSAKGVLKQPAVIALSGEAAEAADEQVPKSTAKPSPRLITDRDLATIRLTNPDREMFEGSGVTKLDIALYYAQSGEAMLPDLLNRPVTLIRCTTGKREDCFHQRHGFSGLPDGVETMGDSREESFLVIRSPRGFLGLPQFGVIEFHPWDCRIEDLAHPDRLTLDLDPGEGVSWPLLVAAAQDLRDRLAALGLTAFPRLSGGAGLHLIAPLDGSADWATARAFLKGVARMAAREAPKLFTDQVALSRRRGRIYLDVGRTVFGASTVASYSLRGREGFPVATPVAWAELRPTGARREFNRAAALARVQNHQTEIWPDFDRRRSGILPEALRVVGVT